MFRLFVEKKEEIAFEAFSIKKEMEYVISRNIDKVKIYNGYDVFNVSKETFQKAVFSIFAENSSDLIYFNEDDIEKGNFSFTTEYLQGQYDQRADFSEQLIKLLNTKENAVVKTFKHIIISDNLTSHEFNDIKNYFINPVESKEFNLKNERQLNKYNEPVKVLKIEGFSVFSDDKLNEIKEKYQIAMSIENLHFCQLHYEKEKKDPTVAELKIFDTYWSDHCRHSTFLTQLENIEIEKNIYSRPIEDAYNLFLEGKKFVYADSNRKTCLMDIATMSMKKMLKLGTLNDLEKSEEVNACSITVKAKIDGKEEDYIIMFKNETHNHPTEMEPFGGASTCLGGGIRDPLSGRSYVYGAIRLTGCADPREKFKDTLKGKLPQRKLTKTAAAGYSSYGNQIGLASGHLMEIYDEGFKAKRMECGALVGAVPMENVLRQSAKAGDVIILLGANTGRDGIGGATGSSKEQKEDALFVGGAEVQKGNPVIERNIVRLFRKKEVSQIIKKCNDFGAGGVCVAVGELADGLLIDLDKVPVKYPGLNATELAISESQERMAVLIDKSNLEKFIKYADEENLQAVKIAEVTDNNRMVMRFNGEEIADICRDFLNSGGIRQRNDVFVKAPTFKLNNDKNLITKEKWLENLKDLNVCSKKSIANMFDATSSNTTVFMPFGGKNQNTPELGLAMKLPLLKGFTNFKTLMTVGYVPKLGYESPFHSGLYAVLESVNKIVATGGNYKKIRLSFQEFFEKLEKDKEKWGKPFSALLGAFYATDCLGLPSIGGKDSMSGSFKDINVPPSLISFAMCCVDDTKLVSRAFKKAKSKVVYLKTPIKEDLTPDFNVYKRNLDLLTKLICEGKVLASSSVSNGGVSATLSEMCFGNSIGIKLNENFKENIFCNNFTDFILELTEDFKDENIIDLGETTEEKSIKFDKYEICLDEALNVWENVLSDVFTQREKTCKITSTIRPKEIKVQKPDKKINNPKVLIPIFPGTNGEYELEKQFTNAKASVTTFMFKTKSEQDILESYTQFAKLIENTDVLAIPTGFSAGGEPDGCSKLISVILCNEVVKKAVNDLITNRKGLVFGVGEGFKALLKTGLIQNGYIKDSFLENTEQNDVFMTKNKHNEYFCSLMEVETFNKAYPFVTKEIATKELVPVSIQEGNICLSDENFQKYLQNGQITTFFTCDDLGTNHSIESMVSENGQVFGRIGLVERMEKGLYENVFECVENDIFGNIVSYFFK